MDILTSSSLQSCIEEAIALMPSPHFFPPREGKTSLFLDATKIHLKDSTFKPIYAFVVEYHRRALVFDCSRLDKKQRDTFEVKEEDCKRANTKPLFFDSKNRIQINSHLPLRLGFWTISMTNPFHNHEMHPDPFCFIQHKHGDSSRANTV